MSVVQSAFTLARLGMGAGKGAGAVFGLFAVAGLAHQEEGADGMDLDAGLHAAEKGLAGMARDRHLVPPRHAHARQCAAARDRHKSSLMISFTPSPNPL